MEKKILIPLTAFLAGVSRNLFVMTALVAVLLITRSVVRKKLWVMDIQAHNRSVYESAQRMISAMYPGYIDFVFDTDEVGALVESHENIPVIITGRKNIMSKLLVCENYTVVNIINRPKPDEDDTADEKIQEEIQEEIPENLLIIREKVNSVLNSVRQYMKIYYPESQWTIEAESVAELIEAGKPLPVAITGEFGTLSKKIVYDENNTIIKIHNTKATASNTASRKLTTAEETTAPAVVIENSEEIPLLADETIKNFVSEKMSFFRMAQKKAAQKGEENCIIYNKNLPASAAKKQKICNCLKLEYGYEVAEVVDEGILLSAK